jgi:VanZ family protein
MTLGLARVSLFLATLMGVAALSLVPPPYKVTSGVFDNHGDHALAYFAAAFAIWVLAGMRGQRAPIFLALCVFAGLMEGCQALSPGRMPAIGDFLASCTGVALGCAAAFVTEQWGERLARMARRAGGLVRET